MENQDSKTEASDVVPENHGQELANLLVSNRNKRNLTLEEVASSTRISLPFLQLLEKGCFDGLPEEVFVRGFIRNLGKLYDFEAAEVLGLYDKVLERKQLMQTDKADEQRVKTKPMPLNNHLSKNKMLHMKAFKPIPLALLGIGVVTGLAITFFVISKDSKEELVSKAKTVEVPEVPAKVEQEMIVYKKTDLGKDGKPLAEKTGEQVVDLKVISEVRIRVSKDGGSWVTESLAPDSYQYRFQNDLSLYLYDAGLVQVTFNGESMGALGQKGKAKRVAFKRDDLKKTQ